MLKDFKYLGLISELQQEEYDWHQVPSAPGVYVIVYRSLNKPQFLLKGAGGWFKKKDPNVPIEKLSEKWIVFNSGEDGIVYIGQSNNLRHRLKLAIRFGKGEPVAKRGGRYIWQINGADNLGFYFKEENNPRQVEKELIEKFKNNHKGRLPFAKLIR